MALKLLARLEGLCFTKMAYCGLLASPSLAFASPQREVGPPPCLPRCRCRAQRLPRSTRERRGSSYSSDTEADDGDGDEDEDLMDAEPLFVAQAHNSFQWRQEKLRGAAIEAIARVKAFADHRELLPDLDRLAPAVAAAVLLLGERKACGGFRGMTVSISRAMTEYATCCTGTNASILRARLEVFRESWKATFHLAAASQVPLLSITGMPWSARAVSATFLGSSHDPHGTLGDSSYLLVRGGRIVRLLEEPEHYLGCLAYTAFQQSSFVDVLTETALNLCLQLETVGIVPCPNIVFEEWILPRLASLQYTASQRERFGSPADLLHIVLGIGEESVRGLCMGEMFLPDRKANRLVDLVRRRSSASRQPNKGRAFYRVKFRSPSRLTASDVCVQSSDSSGWHFQQSSQSKVFNVKTDLAEPDLWTLQYVMFIHVLRGLRARLVAIFMRILRCAFRIRSPAVPEIIVGQRPLTPSTQVPGDTISERSSSFSFYEDTSLANDD
eukprot:Gregarina_sp_Pseudo_9__349@NODE_1226_length_1767_cov_17_307870_g1152_i0_p1_GENE_NODE_1226_length_1767_cov_17_307870_g1152_i0NODE_1226_length_1767_cov_17_307870_g1152_i0_p1_ORF_typecomplete_len499_score34_05_NODE_1226_length_1767_cov_17_307870_g1152_i01101606